MATTAQNSKASTAQEVAGKSPEKLAAEIAAQSRKPLLAVVAIIILAGVIGVVMSGKDKAKKEAQANENAALDAAVLKFEAAGGFSMNTETDEDIQARLASIQDAKGKLGNSDAGKDALFFEAKTQYELGNYDEAAKLFTEYYSANSNRFPMADIARYNAVNSYISAGDIAKAKQTIEAEAGSVSNTVMKDQLQFQLALCATLQGDKKTAETILEELGKENADGTTRAISSKAKGLQELIARTNDTDLKELAKDFPAALVKPEEPKKEDEAKK